MKRFFFSALVLMVCIFTVSCTKNVNNDTPVNYTGQDYFKAIFLMEGELVEDIPSFEYFVTQKELEISENPELLDEIKQTNEQMIAAVKQLDANFFAELKSAVESKNASLVESAINKGSGLLYTAALQNASVEMPELEAELKKVDMSQYDFSKEEDITSFLNEAENVVAAIPSFSNDLGGEYAEGRCVWYFGPAVVAVAAVAVAVYAAIYFWRPDGVDGGLMDISSDENAETFAKEKLVSEIISLQY